MKLEGKPHSSTEIPDVVSASVEVATVSEDGDVIGEAILKAGSDISVSGAILIPSATTAH